MIGNQEPGQKSKRIKRSSFAMGLLKAVGLAGLVIVAASSPYFGVGLIRGIKKHYDKKTWRKFYASLDYLNRRGYVKLTDLADGQIEARITQQGEQIVEILNIDSMKLVQPETWDDKWRVVIFDVPNYKNSGRLAFTEKLKQLGFIMVQKSVWAYPHECHKEIMILRKLYGIEPFVTYFEVVNIEDERDWRGKFNFKHQTD